ncbi:MAG TPA: glycosyltransferase [Candidatus Limnocylindrales bacterium]|nr:glycosyltransferase [Candidatus Limnocylindrales bacterium]
MRLLVVTVHAPYGPSEAFAAAELKELRALGHHVLLAPVRPVGQAIHRGFDAAADTVLVASLISPRVLAMAILEGFRSPRTMARLVPVLARSRSIRILAKNLAVIPKALWLAREARARDVDHIHAYWATTPATVALIASAVAGAPFSFTAHAADIDEDNLIRVKSTRASLLRVISRDGRRRILEAGVAPSVVRLVRLGVDVPDRPAPRAAECAPFVVLVPAAFHPMKGHVHLLDAMRLLANGSPRVGVRLELAGSGPLEADLRQRTKELGLADVVTFLGQLPHESLLARYRDGSVDAVALASATTGTRLAEGVPVSLIEAMSYGIPVVAADSGGVHELVDDATGMLVPMRDPVALAAALRRLALDPQLGDRLGAAGRARVMEEYDVRRTGAELADAMRPTSGGTTPGGSGRTRPS